MAISQTDMERAYYGAQLGWTEDVIATKTTSELRAAFLEVAIIQQPSPLETVAAPPATIGALYSQTEVTNLKNTVAAMRTALINAGLIQ